MASVPCAAAADADVRSRLRPGEQTEVAKEALDKIRPNDARRQSGTLFSAAYKEKLHDLKRRGDDVKKLAKDIQKEKRMQDQRHRRTMKKFNMLSKDEITEINAMQANKELMQAAAASAHGKVVFSVAGSSRSKGKAPIVPPDSGSAAVSTAAASEKK